MRDAYICEPIRTAVGHYGGMCRGIRVPGLQIDRRCGSGLQAVLDAAMRVQTGACGLAIGGGQGLAAVFERVA